jgi:hypothetical protein
MMHDVGIYAILCKGLGFRLLIRSEQIFTLYLALFFMLKLEDFYVRTHQGLSTTFTLD